MADDTTRMMAAPPPTEKIVDVVMIWEIAVVTDAEKRRRLR